MPLVVLPTRHYFAEDVAYLKEAMGAGVCLLEPADYTDDALVALVPEAHVLLGDRVTRPLLEAGRQLKLVQVPWAGVERLDLGLLAEYGIPAASSHSNALAVAEYGVALLLSLAKGVPSHDAAMRRGDWRRPVRGQADSYSAPIALRGLTIGYLGYGRIGSHMARLLQPFGVTQVATKRNPAVTSGLPPSSATGVPDPLEHPHGLLRAVFDPSGFRAMLTTTDVLVVCCPLTSATKGLVSLDALKAMPRGGLLVNIGRGEVVQEEALYQALTDGTLAGAAVDVWYQYPPEPGHPTWPSKRFPFQEVSTLVMSPHRAGFERGSLPHLAGAARNMRLVAAGLPPEDLVDPRQGY